MSFMKKALIFLFIVCCCALTGKSQDVVNLRMDRQQLGLRGYVATLDEDILIRKDYFRDDWPQRKWFVKDLRNVLSEDVGRVMVFNTDGRMMSITYTYQGKAEKTTMCTYTSDGRLTTMQADGYKVEAKYNGNYADINVFGENRTYKTLNLDKADLNASPYTTSYGFDLKCRQELGDDGLVLSSKYYYVDSVLAKECEYNYNHNNMLTSEKTIDYTSEEKLVSFTKYFYDNRDFLIGKTYHSKSVDESCKYENNDLGDCVKMIIQRPYGTFVYTFDYVYDTNDNWTVRLQYLNGVFDNAAIRTITYHKAPAKPKVKVKKEKPSPDDSIKLSKEERKALKEQEAADRKAEKELKAAEKKAEKELKAAERQAEKERKAAEKAAKKNQ